MKRDVFRSTALLLLLLLLARISETASKSTSGSEGGGRETIITTSSRLAARQPDWIVEVLGGCVGALIAPQVVLTTADCAARALTIQVEGVRQTAPSGRNVVVAVQGMVVDRENQAQHDLAVLTLSEAAPVTPAELVEHWDATGADQALRVYNARRSGTGGLEVVSYDVGSEECDARSARNSTSAAICVVPWDASICGERVSGPTFLVSHLREDEKQGDDLVGIRADSVHGCQLRSKGEAEPFLSLAALRAFIDRSSKGHKWAESPTSSSEEPGDTESSGSHGSSSQDAETPSQPLSFPGRAIGFVHIENATVTRFGAPIVLIAPRFAVTRALWLDESRVSAGNSTLAAAFDGETIPVKRFVKQQEEAGSSVQYADDLVVLELGADAVTSPVAILKSTPRLDVVSPDLDLVAIGADAEDEDDSGSATPPSALLSQLSLSKCRSDGAATSERVNVNVPCWDDSQPSPLSTHKQGILRAAGHLVGFSAVASSEQSASKQYSSYPFSVLASERHAQFLEKATESTVVWKDRDGSGSSSTGVRDGFPSFVASFSESSCQAILVAPKYLLTTASCAQDSGASLLSFQLANGPSVEIPYSPAMAIVHPKFNRSAAPAERFDIAIVQLEYETAVDPVVLSFGGLKQTDELHGFSFDTMRFKGVVAPPLFSRVAFNRSEKCLQTGSNSSASTHLPMAFCLTPASRGDPSVLSPDTNSPELSTGKTTTEPTEPALTGAVVGKELNSSSFSMVGFAVAQVSDDGDDVLSVTAIADFAVFINAYVVGTSWEVGGRIMDGPLQFSKRFIVGLRVSQAGQNFCGGSLIAPSFVLTAAHCVTDGLANWVSIGSKASSGAEAEVIPVIKESIVIHSSYGQPSRFSFDAAIFEIKSPAYADPVALDQSPDFADGEKATMYGYGAAPRLQSTSESGLSPEIHAVDLALLSQAQCVATLPEIDRSMLCAVGKNGEDACKGDSGGPLVLPQQEQSGSKETLVGFVSSGYECGLKNVPGIYMRVSSLSGFIRDNTVGAEWSASIAPQPQATTPSPSTPAPALRNLDDPTPRGSDPADGSNGARLVSESQSSQTSKGAIRSVDLPSDVTPQVRSAVLRFLLGTSANTSLSTEFLARLTSDTNQIRFFSTADLSRLLEIIKRHNDKLLYARKDRFGRQQSPGNTIATAC